MVRKHRAPKGALRPGRTPRRRWAYRARQKAPSAKRCIKTENSATAVVKSFKVRKHRAPKGALRRGKGAQVVDVDTSVRKHRAPKGALRRTTWSSTTWTRSVRKHRAPKGALRQSRNEGSITHRPRVRKHRAPKGALRLSDAGQRASAQYESESTERQKVH